MSTPGSDGTLRPASLEELAGAIARAARDGSKVLVVGRGRATLDVGRPSERATAIALDALPLAPSRWPTSGDLREREPRIVRGLGLVRVSGGARVRDVLEELERVGRTLAAPVPGDGTIAGAIATAEQGSGMAAGPLCDSVAAIEMVTVDHGAVRHVRIEPANGIGERARDLVKDDDLFRSALVSLGCSGAITAVTLVTQPAFALEEERALVRWSDLRGALERRARSEDFLELAILPDGRCLVREHERADVEVASIVEPLSRGAAAIEESAGHAIRGPSWQVLRASVGGREELVSTEIVVAIEDATTAIDAALAIVRARGGREPLRVRFSRASVAYLAMQHGRVSCAIEVASEDAALLTAIERALIEPRIGGRPAWGRRHTIAGGFLDHYPKAARWRAAMRRLGGGVFESVLSRRMGLSRG